MDEELIKKVVKGEMRLHELDKALPIADAVAVRRAAVERIRKTQLTAIGKHDIDASLTANKNIENMIGAVQLSLGYAGPLKVNGDHAKGEFLVPMASTGFGTKLQHSLLVKAY